MIGNKYGRRNALQRAVGCCETVCGQMIYWPSSSQLKAFTHYYAFAQKDNNDIYLVGDQVSKLDDLEMDIKAYAVQAEGFANAYKALAGGFPEVFEAVDAACAPAN